MTHNELVERAVKWLLNSAGCSIAFSEFATASHEIPDVIGFKTRWSIVIECKTSRADFFADRKKFFRQKPKWGMGQERYYMIPAIKDNAIEAWGLPDKWGLLLVRGRHVYMIKKSQGFSNRHYPSEIAFLVSMLRRVKLRIDGGPNRLNQWLKLKNLPIERRFYVCGNG